MIFGSPISDENDEVIGTYNIFLSPNYSNNMHVFQYPLRKQNCPYEGNRIKLFCSNGIDSEGTKNSCSSIIKPGSRLQMSFELDTFGSKSFNKNPDGDMNAHCHRYTLKSKPFQPKSEYVVAYIDRNGFHFSLVTSVQQFTPILVDSQKEDSFLSGVDEALIKRQLPNSEHEFDRLQRDLLKERSFMLALDSRTMREMRVFSIGSRESNAMRSRLASPTYEGIEMHARQFSREQVENCLFPPEVYREREDHSTVIHRFSAHYSLEQCLRSLMGRCHILPLSIILRTVASSCERVTEKSVIGLLLNFCFFMHGVWIIYECPLFKGVCDTLRGVVLAHFYLSHDGSVSRSFLNSLVNSSSLRRYIKEILESVAILSTEDVPSQRKWYLRYRSRDISETHKEYERLASLFPREMSKQKTFLSQAFSRKDKFVVYVMMGKPISIFSSISVGEMQSYGKGTENVSPQSGNSIQLSQQEQKMVDDICRHIRTIFLRDGVLNKENLKAKLIEDRQVKYPNATPNLMRIATQSSVQQFTSNTWILKSYGEEAVDSVRPTILSSILSLQSFTLPQLVENLHQHIDPDKISEDIIKRVVSEVTHYSKGDRNYRLKNGL